VISILVSSNTVRIFMWQEIQSTLLFHSAMECHHYQVLTCRHHP